MRQRALWRPLLPLVRGHHSREVQSVGTVAWVKLGVAAHCVYWAQIFFTYEMGLKLLHTPRRL